MFLYLDRNTELARTVDAMMAQAKRIYILMIKVGRLFPFFITVFSERNRQRVLYVSTELYM